MRKEVKILITLFAVSFVSLSSFADNIDVTFNRVRIGVNGVTVSSWDENIKKVDIPSSITYRDTTYVPLRWISDNMENEIAWNGDSKTVSVTEGKNSSVNHFFDKESDLNGNVWSYIMNKKGDNWYLSVEDGKRKYKRVYPIQGEDAYMSDDTSVWFVHGNGYLYRMDYANDENSQDGVKITKINYPNSLHNAIILGDYVFATEKRISNGHQGSLKAYNIKTGEYAVYTETGILTDLKIKKMEDDTYLFSLIEDDVTECTVRFVPERMEFTDFEHISYNGKVNLLRDFKRINLKKEYFNDVINEVKKYINVSEFYVEKGYECYVFRLVDGNNVIFKSNKIDVYKVYLELRDGTQIPLKISDNGGFETVE